jgi:hypothetical protein
VRTTGCRLDVIHASRARRPLRATFVVCATLLMALVLGMILPVGIAPASTTADAKVFDNIYYNALLSGRDPDAALRKAHYLTGSLMQHFGMTRSAAAAEIARTMIMRSGALCSGG